MCSSTFFLKARAFDAFLFSHRFRKPLSMSFSSATLSERQNAARPSTTSSKLAAWIHHLHRWTTGVPFATTLAQSDAQLRRSLQNDRTKWKLVRCNTARASLSLSLSRSLLLTFVLIRNDTCKIMVGCRPSCTYPNIHLFHGADSQKHDCPSCTDPSIIVTKT